MARSFIKSIWGALTINANNSVWEGSDAGAPTSGTSGTGVGIAGPGSVYTNITTGIKYVNTNTKASPTWSQLSTGGGSGVLLIPTSTSPAQTAEGSAVWNSTSDLLTVGTGASRTTMVDVGSVQAVTGVKTFTTPAIGAATGTSFAATGFVLSSSASAGIGYTTGAGSTVTQTTGRTTTVVINAICGDITLVSAAGTTAAQTFTVTNSSCVAIDTVILNQKSGTDKNVAMVTAKANGSFAITFYTTGGTTTEQPVFSFSVIKGVIT